MVDRSDFCKVHALCLDSWLSCSLIATVVWTLALGTGVVSVMLDSLHVRLVNVQQAKDEDDGSKRKDSGYDDNAGIHWDQLSSV